MSFRHKPRAEAASDAPGSSSFRPTPQQLLAAQNKSIPDLLIPNLTVLFVGINPGLYSAAIRHHFGRPGNRFWPALHRAGFTPRQLSPFEERELLNLGIGITNVVPRATASAAELQPQEFLAGATKLVKKIHRYQPRVVTFLGIGAYRTAFNQPKAQQGRQANPIADSQIWVLPNPSGLNAHFTPAQLANVYRDFRIAIGFPSQ